MVNESKTAITIITTSIVTAITRPDHGEHLSNTTYYAMSSHRIKKRNGTFVMPVRPGARFEFHRHAVGCQRRLSRTIKHVPLSLHILCQRAEQRNVILAAEEQDFVVRVLAQHAEVLVLVVFAPPLVGIVAARSD